MYDIVNSKMIISLIDVAQEFGTILSNSNIPIKNVELGLKITYVNGDITQYVTKVFKNGSRHIKLLK